MADITPDRTAVIANGASLSGAIEINGAALVGIFMPSAWTAAAITLQASLDGTNYNNVYDKDGNEISITTAASRYVKLDPTLLVGAQYVKVRSGTAGSPVAQGAERSIGVMIVPI